MDLVHWAYVFAVLGRFYGFGPEAVLRLTPTQTRHYLEMVPYVSEWSEEAGTIPPLPPQYRSEPRQAKDLARWKALLTGARTNRHKSKRSEQSGESRS
ncbi:MAG: hypothetical protein KatS3mg115_1386 [Candidatus Poribacteria bacterium]|nr:MAG: hypothetical protein KatS3mg115_1386 [Candidatus Poribacteria bacterium]